MARKLLLAGMGAALSLIVVPAMAQSLRSPAASGRVTCMATSAQENSAAAAATSQVRQANGLGKMRASNRLAEAAAKHACDMARRDQMTHRGSATKGPSQRAKAEGYKTRLVAENIGKGFSQVGQVMDAWNRSRGHRDNILLPQVRDFGIGKAIAADGQTVYWAAVYALPR